ncbi:MAG: sulfotransferase domain-containing protein [Opitutales bacterium]
MELPKGFFDDVGKPIVVSSHPRSGTHLTLDTLRRNFPACRTKTLPLETVHNHYYSAEALTLEKYRRRPAWMKKILQRGQRPLVKTHMLPNLPDLETYTPEVREWLLSEADFVYVVRDGRSVMSSFYLFLQSFNEDARKPFPEFLRGSPGKEGEHVHYWVRHVSEWCDKPGVKAIRCEDLLKKTEPTVRELGEFLGIEPDLQNPPLPPKPSSVWEVRRRRLHRIADTTAILSFYGGNKTEDWRKLFSDADMQYFLDICGSTMERYGYLNSGQKAEMSGR